jgi:hypothetical protein
MALRGACPNRGESCDRHKEFRHAGHFANKIFHRGFHFVFSFQKVCLGSSGVNALAVSPATRAKLNNLGVAASLALQAAGLASSLLVFLHAFPFPP